MVCRELKSGIYTKLVGKRWARCINTIIISRLDRRKLDKNTCPSKNTRDIAFVSQTIDWQLNFSMQHERFGSCSKYIWSINRLTNNTNTLHLLMCDSIRCRIFPKISTYVPFNPLADRISAEIVYSRAANKKQSQNSTFRAVVAIFTEAGGRMS